MSIWEKVFKNPKAVATLKGDTLSVPDIEVTAKHQQLPSLHIGLALGTSYTKRTFFCQLGSEMRKWNPESPQQKMDMSVFRVEKADSDNGLELVVGEEALSNFMSDRSDPPCTLFLQPNRFLLNSIKIPSYVTLYDSQKVLYQAPTNDEIYRLYVEAQLRYLQSKARQSFPDIRRFQVGQICAEYPDYFAAADVKRYRNTIEEAVEKVFPPTLPAEEETPSVGDRVVFLPEAVVTFLHWLTDKIEAKLASSEIELKKFMVSYGMLPRTTDEVNFLIVTMGATHSRVVRLKVDSLEDLASAKRAGQNVTIFHNYLGRTGFGGDHISCNFLNEEEEKRYGATAAHRVSTLSRKVFEDWNKLTGTEGKKHFDELCGDHFHGAVDKLGELVIKGYSESPENTIVILGGRVFEVPHLRDTFREYLNSHRIPLARISMPSGEEVSVEKSMEILHFHQKGLGRVFSIKTSLEAESSQKFTWKIGKVVEGTLVDTILEADHKDWNEENPRTFTVNFEKGVRRLNLGYQKTAGGLSQMWANVNLKVRVSDSVKVTFSTSSPDELKIKEINVSGDAKITESDVQIEMLIAGEQPSSFPLYDNLLQ